MKAGQFHRMFVCVDPRVIVTPAGTATHNVIFAESQRALDALITENGWKRNQGYYYAPADWRNIRLVVPHVNTDKFVPALYIQDPRDLRQDLLIFTKSEIVARFWASQFGWRKVGNIWTRT